MIANIIQDNELEAKDIRISRIFTKEYRVRYNKKLSGKVRLYISEKNALKDISGILSLYKHNFH